MDRERWEHLQQLLEEALTREGVALQAFLDAACAGDDDLRRELTQLLEAHTTGGPVERLERAWSVSLSSDRSTPRPLSGERIGPFRLVREVGHGGMGTVYVAERADGQFEQTIALKLIRDEVETAELRARFLHERQTLARLEHPNIARLVGGGLHTDGRPWFAMEIVDGVPINVYCDDNLLDLEKRLRLFLQVCDAVQYAHQNLVVHRDLKPSNILVTKQGVVKLLDFGVAKWLDQSRDPVQTEPGRRWMTLAYAAPEQIRGEPVTTATDVYALGVLCYELLSGRRPFGDSEASEYRETERAILEDKPAKPSTRTSVPVLQRQLSGDLDTIVLKALRKEADRRYPSADALVADVTRYLGGHPVLARPDTPGYRAGKFVRRHRVGVAATGLVILSLLAGAAGTVWQARKASEKARIAELERDRSAQVSDFLVGLFSLADPNERAGDTLTARMLLDKGRARVESELAGQADVLSEMWDVMGRAYAGIGLHEPAEALLRQAVAARRGPGGSSPNRELALSLQNLGNELSAQGEYREAERDIAEARDAFATLGDSALARATFDLAVVVHRSGDFERAIPLFEEAIAFYRDRPGANEEAAFGLETIGQIRSAQRRFGEAEPLFREALAIRKKLTAGDDDYTAADLIALARVLRDTDHLDAAEPVALEGLEMWRRIHRDPHTEVATAAHTYARILIALGRYSEAEAYLNEALSTRRSLLGGEHPSLIVPTLDLADLLVKTNRLDESEARHQEAIRMTRARFGDEHAFIVSALVGLGHLAVARGESDKAERNYRDALTLARSILREGHPLIAQCEHDLAELLAGSGRCPEAVPLYENALAIRLAIHTPTNRMILETKSALADCRRELEVSPRGA